MTTQDLIDLTRRTLEVLGDGGRLSQVPHRSAHSVRDNAVELT